MFEFQVESKHDLELIIMTTIWVLNFEFNLNSNLKTLIYNTMHSAAYALEILNVLYYAN